MKEKVISYFITVGIVCMAAAGAWLVLHLASANTAATIGGPEAGYSSLEQSILK